MVLLCMNTPYMSSERNNTPHIVAAVAIVLLVAGSIYLTAQMGLQSRVESHLDEERLRSESLLSEKLSLEKVIHNLKADMEAMTQQNDALNNTLKSTTQTLQTLEHQLKESRKPDAAKVKLEKQRAELLAIKQNLEAEIVRYETIMKELQHKNTELQLDVTLIEDLNKILSDEVNALRRKSMDGILTQAAKKNNKLTVKASRTRKLMVETDLYADVAKPTISIINAEGKEIEILAEEMTLTVVKREERQTASLHTMPSSPGQSFKRVRFVYIPRQKLKPGVYKVIVRDDTTLIGSVQVELV